jgi:hypothetical protein
MSESCQDSTDFREHDMHIYYYSLVLHSTLRAVSAQSAELSAVVSQRPGYGTVSGIGTESRVEQ